MRQGWPASLEDTCVEARYYARNWSSKTNLDPEECEQIAMISAWEWWRGAKERTDLWHMVKFDLIDYARSVTRRRNAELEAWAEVREWMLVA